MGDPVVNRQPRWWEIASGTEPFANLIAWIVLISLIAIPIKFALLWVFGIDIPLPFMSSQPDCGGAPNYC